MKREATRHHPPEPKETHIWGRRGGQAAKVSTWSCWKPLFAEITPSILQMPVPVHFSHFSYQSKVQQFRKVVEKFGAYLHKLGLSNPFFLPVSLSLCVCMCVCVLLTLICNPFWFTLMWQSVFINLGIIRLLIFVFIYFVLFFFCDEILETSC